MPMQILIQNLTRLRDIRKQLGVVEKHEHQMCSNNSFGHFN